LIFLDVFIIFFSLSINVKNLCCKLSNMNFSKISSILDRVDAALGNLRSGVDVYTMNVNEMGRLHTAILQHAAQSEDRILFLMRLNQALFLELEKVEGEGATIVNSLPVLNDTIAQQQNTIQQLNISINTLNEQLNNIGIAAETEIGKLQTRAESQLGIIQALQNDLDAANVRLNNDGSNLSAMYTQLGMLRTTRDNELNDLQRNISLRESLRSRLGDLDRERNELQQMLSAVETVPLSQENVQSRATTGFGSRGGPGSRAFAGMDTSAILPERTRGR
jgi:chromosome segregation ATPase